MSCSTRILTVSREICACAAADIISAAARPARAATLIRFSSLLNSEIVVQFAEVLRQLGIAEHVDDPAVLDDVMAVGDCRGEAEILLDQEHRKPFRLQCADD